MAASQRETKPAKRMSSTGAAEDMIRSENETIIRGPGLNFLRQDCGENSELHFAGDATPGEVNKAQ
jgi:hypothetical protein